MTGRHQPLPAAPASPVRPARGRRTLIAPGATAEEAAAIVAAIERFVDDTAPAPSPPPPTTAPGRWLRTALLEGVSRTDRGRGGWGDRHR